MREILQSVKTKFVVKTTNEEWRSEKWVKKESAVRKTSRNLSHDKVLACPFFLFTPKHGRPFKINCQINPLPSSHHFAGSLTISRLGISQIFECILIICATQQQVNENETMETFQGFISREINVIMFHKKEDHRPNFKWLVWIETCTARLVGQHNIWISKKFDDDIFWNVPRPSSTLLAPLHMLDNP